MLGTLIEERLKSVVGASSVVVTDDSKDHEGHGASGAHVSVVVVAEAFRGKSPVARHRMIYAALAEEMKGTAAPIHALAITAKAPGE